MQIIYYYIEGEKMKKKYLLQYLTVSYLFIKMLGHDFKKRKNTFYIICKYKRGK